MPGFSALSVVKARYQDVLLRKAHVLAVGLGLKKKNGEVTGMPVVKVFVSRKVQISNLAESDLIPPRLSAADAEAPTDVEEMETLRAPVQTLLAAPVKDTLPLRIYQRPVYGGLSAAHYQFQIGTVAIPVTDRVTFQRYLLSNNHVFALLNNARIGDPILQPALIDGGSVRNSIIAFLDRFIPLRLDGIFSNVADAALARVAPNATLLRVAMVGAPVGVRPARELRVGESVCKVGRTTGLTFGHVIGIGCRCKINYSIAGYGDRVAVFDDQILTSAMAGYGDSGSLLVDGARNAVGMLGGGSATHTMYNPCDLIQELLAIRIGVTFQHTFRDRGLRNALRRYRAPLRRAK